MTDRKRVTEMMSGKEEAKLLFALQTRSQARTIISHFLTSDKDINEILDLIGEEHITGYQLRDVFDEHKNFNVIKKKLEKIITENQLVKAGIMKEKEEEKEEDKKKKDIPQEDIEKMLKSLGLNDCIPKLKEKEINDPEIFFELGADSLIGILEITTEGKKYRFKEKMKEVVEKHEKAKAKKEQEDIAEIVGEAFENLQKKVSVIFWLRLFNSN